MKMIESHKRHSLTASDFLVSSQMYMSQFLERITKDKACKKCLFLNNFSFWGEATIFGLVVKSEDQQPRGHGYLRIPILYIA